MNSRRGEGRVSRTCLVCGKEFFTYRAWIRNGSGGKFCSTECQRIGKIKTSVDQKVYKKCVVCGCMYRVKRYRMDSSVCCSVVCLSVYRGSKLRGELSPRWKGGISKRPYAVRVWAREVLKRDGCCVRCGSTYNLTAHHVQSYADNPEMRFELENGVTLCGNCHAEEHGDLSPDFVKHQSKREVKICGHCGESFVGKSSSIFCSNSCKYAGRRKVSNAKIEKVQLD